MQAIEKQEIIERQLRFAAGFDLDLFETTDVTSLLEILSRISASSPGYTEVMVKTSV